MELVVQQLNHWEVLSGCVYSPSAPLSIMVLSLIVNKQHLF